MRILHVTDHYPPVLGGIETHVSVARRTAGGSSRRHRAHLHAARADGRIGDDSGRVRRRSVPGRWSRACAPTSPGFDLVHAHISVVAPFTAPVTALFARRGVPTVVTVHSLWNGMGPFPRWVAGLSGLRSAPVRWTAVSPVAAEQVRVRLPSGARVGVLANAVDVAPRASTPAADRPLRLVSTMRIAARKRPLELLQSSTGCGGPPPSRAPDAGRRRSAASAGRAVDPQTWASRTACGSPGGCEPSSVHALLASADVYVAPAILESFGLAALEARTVGLPVVGLSGTGLTGFVREGVEGLLCDGDGELVDAMRALLEDNRLRRWISEHNRTVPSDLTWARALVAHERLYDEARVAETVLEP